MRKKTAGIMTALILNGAIKNGLRKEKADPRG